MDRAQSSHLLRMATPLGPDRLFAVSVAGEEALSELFAFRVRAFALDPIADPSEILGLPAVVTLTTVEGRDRHFHGYVAAFEYDGYRQSDQVHHYSLTLRPWFWFLSLRADSRIFQEKSVIAIAEEIFGEMNFTDFRVETSGAFANRTYCVQYRETSFAFLSRLFEEEGIYYYFEHEDDRHTLVLADTAMAHQPIAGGATLRAARQEMGDDASGVSEWREVASVTSGRVTLNDFDPLKPRASLIAGIGSNAGLPAAQDLEVFDYPGRYREMSDGDTFASVRMEALEARSRMRTGTTNEFTICPGFTFDLVEHEVEGYNVSHLVTRVAHEAENNWEFGEPRGARYRGTFECIPADTQFRAPRVTPKPTIDGLQTAIVTGPGGEEIHVDRHGRVKVQFHWDRRGAYDEKSSCWIRVAQGWAGIRFGQTFIPRIGMEVAVSFLEGDPDRPLITGVVHNAVNEPVYDPPGHKTRSTIKTNSSPGGGGFNELRFEDKAGSEQIFVHGQKDMDLRIKETLRSHVGDQHHETVVNDRFEKVGGDQHEDVGGDRSARIGGIDSLDIAQEFHAKAGTNYAVKAGMEVMIEAGMMLTIKAGAGFITLGPSGVTIQGPMVLINSGGSSGSLSANPQAPDAPAAADDGQPGATTDLTSPKTVPQGTGTRKRVSQIAALREAAVKGTPFCEICGEAGA